MNNLMEPTPGIAVTYLSLLGLTLASSRGESHPLHRWHQVVYTPGKVDRLPDDFLRFSGREVTHQHPKQLGVTEIVTILTTLPTWLITSITNKCVDYYFKE
jgi:hypothetical protein